MLAGDAYPRSSWRRVLREAEEQPLNVSSDHRRFLSQNNMGTLFVRDTAGVMLGSFPCPPRINTMFDRTDDIEFHPTADRVRLPKYRTRDPNDTTILKWANRLLGGKPEPRNETSLFVFDYTAGSSITSAPWTTPTRYSKRPYNPPSTATAWPFCGSRTTRPSPC